MPPRKSKTDTQNEVKTTEVKKVEEVKTETKKNKKASVPKEAKEKKEPVVRVKPTRDVVLKELEDLVTRVQTETVSQREKKTGGCVKFLQTLRKDLSTLHRRFTTVCKVKRERKAGSSTSGFSREVDISKEMAKFMGLSDTKASRPQVTKAVSDYIRSHNLYHKSEKKEDRYISCDKTLEDLFKGADGAPKVGGRFTWMGDIQRFIKHHFVRSAAPPAVAATPAPTASKKK
jgi:chromatin remodeling complex protein RSC6